MSSLRRVSIICAAIMLSITIVLFYVITRIYEENTIEQAKGEIARAIQSAARRDLTEADLSSPRYGRDYDETLKRVFDICRMQGVLTTIVFSNDGAVVWSDDRTLVGKRFPNNLQLREALQGRIGAEITAPENEDHPFPIQAREVLELYVPIGLGDRPGVAGVVEIYRDIGALRSSMRKTATLVTGVLLAGFGILFLVLYRVFRGQEELAGRMLSLMNNVPGLVYRGLPDWSVAFIGAEAERITGYTAEEFLSGAIRWRDLIHFDDVGPITQTMRDAVKAGNSVLRVEYRARQKDGSYRWIADRRQLIYDAHGRLAYVDGLALDITPRKRSEEMLQLTQFSVDRAGDAAYWMGPDGRLLYVNEQACRTLGYSRDELLSLSIHEINPGFPPEIWAAHWEDLRTRKSFTLESRHRAKDGRLIPVEVTVNFVEFDGKEYNCASARDITERVQAREESRLLQSQLLQSQKMEAIGSLAGGIAHDFNNLLTGILGYANLLKFKADPGGEVYKASEVILDAAERASQLTAQLLGFARKGKNLAVPVDIHKTIDAVTALLDRTLDKRIRINKVFTLQGAAIVGDPTQVQQVIMNLAMNARDAMPDGGELSISTEIVVLDEAYCRTRPGASPGRCVRVEVSDTGVGIPKDNLEKIFDPFFTTKAHGKGTGLGLSMVFGIVKNHGGYIEVQSAVDTGTTFRVCFPAAAGKAGAEETDFSEEVKLGSGRGRILLIDDQETVREVCSAMLQNLGYKVNTACDGLEGVDYYRRHGRDIDLVIIDMVMPNMGGRDCFRGIKTINPNVRAILSTGFSLDGAVQDIIDEGIAAFIQKPYRMEQLSQVVSVALGRSENPSATNR